MFVKSFAFAFLAAVPLSLIGCGDSLPSDHGDHLGRQAEFLTTTFNAADEVQWKQTTLAHLPGKLGCFTTAYPTQSWTQVPCAPSPLPGSVTSQGSKPPPTTATMAGGSNAAPLVVGNGLDWFAHTNPPTNLIQDVDGTFHTNNVTREYDLQWNQYNSFALQVNSNYLSDPPPCGSQTSCIGWQQFEYSSWGYEAIFTEYWLYYYQGSNCPAGWDSAGAGTNICNLWGNSEYVGQLPITDLQNLELLAIAGLIGGGQRADWVVLYDHNSGNSWAVSTDASALSLYQYWNESEFNVVGDMGGSEAVFNSGATIQVKQEITPQSTSGNWLTCNKTGNWWTEEYNNLNFPARSTCPATRNSGSCGPTNSGPVGNCGYIQFTESD